MGLNNVAMIMAPNLFFQNNAKININEARKAAGMTDVLRMLIKYQPILWTVCGSFFEVYYNLHVDTLMLQTL